MSLRIREALAVLERDVATLRLDPPEAIRARGESRRRRQAVGAVAAALAGAAVTGAVALPVLHSSREPGGRTVGVAAPPSIAPPSATCTAALATAAPSKLPPADAAKDAYPDSRAAKVFLTPTATPGDKAAIEARLRSLRVVAGFDFVDHRSAWQRFAQQYCAAPDLVAATSPDSLPESFHLVLKQPGDLAAVQASLAGLAGVGHVVHTPE